MDITVLVLLMAVIIALAYYATRMRTAIQTATTVMDHGISIQHWSLMIIRYHFHTLKKLYPEIIGDRDFIDDNDQAMLIREMAKVLRRYQNIIISKKYPAAFCLEEEVVGEPGILLELWNIAKTADHMLADVDSMVDPK